MIASTWVAACNCWSLPVDYSRIELDLGILEYSLQPPIWCIENDRQSSLAVRLQFIPIRDMLSRLSIRPSAALLRSSRLFHSSRTELVTSSFDGDRPAPPRLPPHLQKEFEELQRRAAAPLANTKLSSSNLDGGGALADSKSSTVNGGDVHPDLRMKPKPEFEGDYNPRTGEVGGPKNDPLGYEKEWTYGGRATDF